MTRLNRLIRQFAGKANQGRRAADRLRALVDRHFEHPGRRDGRGRRAQAVLDAQRTLRHLVCATDWQNRPNLDFNDRREARALVRTASHGQGSFADLMERAKKLRGRINQRGAERNARLPIKGCDPLREGLPRCYVVERLHTRERLAWAGRKLGNCAKNNAHCLHDRLWQRESDFYVIGRGDDLVAMFEVDLETNVITEFHGKENADVKLPRDALIALQRRLGLNGDGVDACLQQGAASIFAARPGAVHEPDWRCGNLKVWWAERQLVFKESRRRRPWSSFTWSGANWAAADASSRRRLDGLMTRHPFLAKLAHAAALFRRER